MTRSRAGPVAARGLLVVALACLVASFAARPAPGRVVASARFGPVAAAPGHRGALSLPSGVGGAPTTGSMTLGLSVEIARPQAGQTVVRAGSAVSGMSVRLVHLLGQAPSMVARLAPWPGGPLKVVLVPAVRPGRPYRLRLILANVRTFSAYVNGVEVASFQAPQPAVTAVLRPVVVGSGPSPGRGGPSGPARGAAVPGPSVTGAGLSYQVRALSGSSTAAVALLTLAGLAAMALVFLLVVSAAADGVASLGAFVPVRPLRRGLAWCRRHLGWTGLGLLVVGGAVLQVVTPPADAVGPQVGHERLALASVPRGRVVRELFEPLPKLGPGRPSADERLSFTLELSRRPVPGSRPLLTTWVHGTGVAVSAGRDGLLVASIRTFAEQGGTFALVRHAPVGRPLHILITVVRSRTVEAEVNGRQVYAYSFASPVWGPEPTGLEVGVPGARYRISDVVATTALYGRPSPASSLLVVRLLQALGFALVAGGAVALAARFGARLVPAARPSRSLVRVAFGVAAAGIVANLLVDALHLQTVPAPYTHRNTWLFASDARFSDFLQTFQLLKGLHPYGIEAGSYPPVGYFLVGPFVAMSSFAALACFLALFVGVFGWWCWRAFAGGRRVEAAGIVVVAFASYPVSFALDRANVDLLVALLLVAAVAGLDANRDRLSAVLVGVAAAAKVFPGVYALLFIRRSAGWRRFALALAVAVGTTLVGLMALPGSLAANIDGLRQGIHSVQLIYANGVQSTLYSSTLPSFFQAVGYTLGGASGAASVATWTTPLATAEEVIGGLLLAWYLWRRPRATWRAVTLVTVAILLLPQVAYAYDLVYLLVPLSLLVRDAPDGPGTRRIAALFGLLLAPKSYLYLGTSFINSSTLLEAPLLVALAVAVVLDGRAEARAGAPEGSTARPLALRRRPALTEVTPAARP